MRVKYFGCTSNKSDPQYFHYKFDNLKDSWWFLSTSKQSNALFSEGFSSEWPLQSTTLSGARLLAWAELSSELFHGTKVIQPSCRWNTWKAYPYRRHAPRIFISLQRVRLWERRRISTFWTKRWYCRLDEWSWLLCCWLYGRIRDKTREWVHKWPRPLWLASIESKILDCCYYFLDDCCRS